MSQKFYRIFISILILIALVISCVLLLHSSLALNQTAQSKQGRPVAAQSVQIMDSFDAVIAPALKDAENAMRNTQKIFWLRDNATEAPVANPAGYGSTQNPLDMQPVLDKAKDLLNGQQTLFSTDIVLKPGSEITYYLDETILAITWKQVIDNYVYTVSEIKVAHPSQFRRHLAGGVYGSQEYTTVRAMSNQVNAIVGSSADFYMARSYGTKVYDGIVRSVELAHACDICYIDRNGDLIFSHKGEMTDPDTIQNFVDEHDINFSISFGPILIENGATCVPDYYALGEINRKYSRTALCQMGPLHYLVVVGNSENEYFSVPTLYEFAENLLDFGCQKAYTMDGGNTGNIVMNGNLINIPARGFERIMSDILYFCTAIPNPQ